MKKIYQIFNFLSLSFTLVINYLANTSQVGGKSIGEISNQYENLLTPEGYAFSIWGLIYLALFIFAIYQAIGLFKNHRSNDIVLKIKGWFILANLANAGWVVAFSNDLIGLSVLIILVLFFSLLKIVLNLNMELTDPPLSVILCVWWPISIYFGWITVAMVANIATYLTKLGYGGEPLTPVSWAIILLAIVTVICIAMIWSRNMREYALVGIWGIVAIGVRNWELYPIIAITAFVLSLIIFINIAIHGFKNRKALRKKFFPTSHHIY